MKPFSTYATQQDRAEIYFFAQSRVLNGRFILHHIWEHRNLLEPVSVDSFRPSALCPHLNISKRSNQYLQTNPLTFTFTTALENFGRQIPGSCSRCPTDYLITIYRNRAKIRVWKDFGNPTSPIDIRWCVHIWDRENNEFYGPSVSHQPQSIMNAYYNAAGRTFRGDIIHTNMILPI
jgi:hypothetical protein